ncbi:MAG: hydroxyacid dehydrogenase [Candidatus Staskawiczbacteria bacterium]|nr:hydroxyacid dehydrogenase [Candidatus Staskawiczbacteria bacterium]
MRKFKIAFFEVTSEKEKEFLHTQFKNVEISFFAQPLSLHNVEKVRDYDIVAVFIDSQMNQDLLGKFTNLKLITTRSTGFDHIDVETCKKLNIAVCNVPHYGDNAVAEYTFALILDLSRKIHQSITDVKNGGFSFKGFTGFDLSSKTLGIVGMGNIGQHVARIAKGFEMNVIAHDSIQNKKLAKNLGFKYVTLEHLLENSDIITLHVPYNKNTHHLINSDNIRSVKHGAYLINTARGGIIETGALVGALSLGIIAGAGLDVLEEENFIKEELSLLHKENTQKIDYKVVMEDHMLMEHKNVIVTPHNAFNSKEALKNILGITALNIRSFIKRKPTNLVK